MSFIRNKKNFLGILLFSLLFAVCQGQTTLADSSAQSKTVQAQAEKMGSLLLKKKYSAFTKFTYPKVVELMGGEKSMIQMLKRGVKQMSSDGTKFLNITIGEPSKIITHGNELQCSVPETIEMKVKGGRLIKKSTLLAISQDGGKNWFFVDTSGKDIKAMRKLLPNLSSALIIPVDTEPIFFED